MKDLKATKLAVIFTLLMSVLSLEAQFVQAALDGLRDQQVTLPYDQQTGNWPGQTTTELGLGLISFTITGSNPDPTLSWSAVSASRDAPIPVPEVRNAMGVLINSGTQVPAGTYNLVYPENHSWTDPGVDGAYLNYEYDLTQGAAGNLVRVSVRFNLVRGPTSTGTGTGTAPPTGTGTAPPTGTGTAPPTGTGTAPPTGTGTAPPTGTGTGGTGTGGTGTGGTGTGGTGTGGTGTGGTGTGGTGTGGTGTGGTGTLINHWPPPWIIQWWQKQLPMVAQRGIFEQPSERLFHQHLRANHFGRVALRLPTPFFHFRADQRPRVNPTDPTVVILNWRYSPNSSRPKPPPSVGGRPRR